MKKEKAIIWLSLRLLTAVLGVFGLARDFLALWAAAWAW